MNNATVEIQVVEMPNGMYYLEPKWHVGGATSSASRLAILRALEGSLRSIIGEIQEEMAKEENDQ